MQSLILGAFINVIQLDRHIEILLLDNDCVIVPGLGGFMAHHICARYCPDSQTYLPPLRQLGFNAQLKINDSLLAQSYIEAYDISYPEALRRIEEEVTELIQLLQNQGYCELNDIGILRVNIEGNIEFEPCEAGILTPELYGLNTVDIMPLAKSSDSNNATKSAEPAKPAAAPLEIFNETPKPEPQLAVAGQVETNDTKDEEEEDEAPTISIRISTIKHVSAVAAIILALFMCAIPFGKTTQPELTESYMDTGILYKILPQEKCSPNTDTTVRTLVFHDVGPVEQAPVPEDTEKVEKTEKAEKAEATPETAADTKAQPSATETKADNTVAEDAHEPQTFYSIILASRTTRANAHDFIKRIAKSGIIAEMVNRPNGGVKVICGHYQTEAEARRQLSVLREASEEFADCWVMEFTE